MYNTRFSSVGVTLAVAVGYAICGLLGQLASVPPGYSTIIWPASGLALGAALLFGNRALFGVLLGSFAINSYISLSIDSSLPFLLTPIIIGLFATLQAYVGKLLVERFIGFPFNYFIPKYVISFLVLGGVVSTLVNATLSVFFLHSVGLVPVEAVTENWLIWWLGDAIGVIFTIPWLIVFFPNISKLPKSKMKMVLLTLLGTLIFVALVTGSSAYGEKLKQQASFSDNSTLLANTLATNVTNATNTLYSLKGFVLTNPDINPHSFREFTDELITRYPVLHGISWNRAFNGEELANFENLIAQQYAKQTPPVNFRVSERGVDGQLIKSRPKDRHVVVTYIEPFSDNSKALGFDVYSNASRKTALDTALTNNSIHPTAPINLVQETASQAGILVFLPVHEKNDTQLPLLGYATIVLRMGDLVTGAIGNILMPDTAMALIDVNESGENSVLYSTNYSAAELTLLKQNEVTDNQFLLQQFALATTAKIKVGSHDWYLIHTNEHIFVEHPWLVHVLASGGFIFAGLLGWYMLVVAGHADEIEHQVEQRTKELNEVANQLREAQKLQQEEREAALKAKLENRAKSEFLANMSHEIRTPLNAILGFSELIKSEASDKSITDKASKINQSGELLLSIVSDILDLSKIERNEMALESHVFLLSAILKQIHEVFEPRCKEEGVAFKLNFGRGCSAYYVGDPLRLKQVLLNVTSNAVKFTHKGEVSLSMQCEPMDEHFQRLTWVISDTGIGMSKAQIEDIFVAFSQADTSNNRQYGGTGIGMTIVQQLVELMDGTVAIESEIDKGTTVTLSIPFPVASREQIDDFKRANVRATMPVAVKFSGNVLVVEDNVINQQVMMNQLTSLGLTVHIAEHGGEAVSLVKEHSFDVILMDIQMPIMDGFAATRKMRADGIQVPIIAVTAAAMIEDKQKALAAGMNEHLSKPCSRESLIAVLRSYLTNE